MRYVPVAVGELARCKHRVGTYGIHIYLLHCYFKKNLNSDYQLIGDFPSALKHIHTINDMPVGV
jgi:hypothetical protein